MFRDSLHGHEINTSPVPVINLAEGIDFKDRADYAELLEVIEQRLEQLGISSPDLLLAGYDAQHDDHPDTPERNTTWALPLKQIREDMLVHPRAHNPFVYADVGIVSGTEPTIAAYDPSKMQLLRGDAEHAAIYKPLPGYTINTAKLVEFPISYVDEAIALPEQPLSTK